MLEFSHRPSGGVEAEFIITWWHQTCSGTAVVTGAVAGTVTGAVTGTDAVVGGATVVVGACGRLLVVVLEATTTVVPFPVTISAMATAATATMDVTMMITRLFSAIFVIPHYRPIAAGYLGNLVPHHVQYRSTGP
jgi:hypothetical protein